MRTRSAACECRTRVLPSPERACNGAAHGLGATFRAGRQLSRRSDRRRGSRGLDCRARIRARGSSQPARLWFRAAPWRSVARRRPASRAPSQPRLGSALQHPDQATSPPAVLRGACGEAFYPDRLEDDRGDDRLEISGYNIAIACDDCRVRAPELTAAGEGPDRPGRLASPWLRSPLGLPLFATTENAARIAGNA